MKLTELYKGKKIFWTGKEMLDHVPQQTPWLIQGLIGRGDNVLVNAEAKTGKSVWSMQEACHIASGTPLLDEFAVAKPEKVLYVQAEMTMDQVNSRFQKMHKALQTQPDNIRWLYVPRLPFIGETAAQEFIESIEEGFPGFTPSVFIFDPVYMLSGGRSLKDDDVVQSIVSNLSVVKFKYNATIILNHHNNRGSKNEAGDHVPGDYFGSFIFDAWPDVRFNCARKGNKGVVISCKADRNGDKTLNLNLTLNEPDPLFFELDADPESRKHMKTVMEVFDNKTEASLTEIVKYVGVNKTLANGAVKLLIKEGKIKREGTNYKRL